ncbi:MAG TPA: hypothetical protein ENI16_00845 [Candidatus Portnoybacteria bacterium]|nr:hypothetical protein [Candidatus Portnoybacteria bacterium]
MNFKIPKTKKFLVLFSLIVALSSLGIFLLAVPEAGAEVAEWLFEKTIGPAMGAILSVIFGFLSSCLGLVAQIVDWVLNLGSFGTAGVVNVGWGITRDLANMFFILILLVIAFATILRVETYGLKALLPKLIIAALLINFSKVIAVAIIDFSQVLTKFFIDAGAGGENVSETIAHGLNIAKIFESGGVTGFGKGIEAMIATQTGLLLGIIVVLVALFTFLAMAVLLFFRILALWFLIILAPMAWLLWILPATRSQWNKWWSEFIKWSFFAPIYAFFIYLALYIIQKGGLHTQLESEFTLEKQEGFWSAFGSGAEIVMSYILLIMILLGGLVVAQSMSIKGASGALGGAKAVGRLPWRAARRTVGYGVAAGVKKFEREVLAPRGLSPRAFISGWKARRDRIEEEQMAKPVGDWRDRTNRFLSRGKEVTNYGRRARLQLVDKEKKELELETGGNTEALVNSIKTGRPERAEAAMYLLGTSNDYDEVLVAEGKEVNAQNLMQYTKDRFGEEEGARIYSNMQEISLRGGNLGFWGGAYYDPAEEKYKFEWNNAKRVGKAVQKAKTVSEMQMLMRSMHRNTFVKEKFNPDTNQVEATGLTDFAMGIEDPETGEWVEGYLSQLTDAAIKQCLRTKLDLQQRLADPKVDADVKKAIRKAVKPEIKKYIKRFVDEFRITTGRIPPPPKKKSEEDKDKEEPEKSKT